MEIAFRTALVAWLRADPLLADMLNSIEEDGPVAASPPTSSPSTIAPKATRRLLTK